MTRLTSGSHGLAAISGINLSFVWYKLGTFADNKKLYYQLLCILWSFKCRRFPVLGGYLTISSSVNFHAPVTFEGSKCIRMS